MSEKGSGYTRQRRVDRQALDDGDPDDRVWFRSKGAVYHATRECAASQAGDRQPQPGTRRAAQRRWLAPCLHCILDSFGGHATIEERVAALKAEASGGDSA